MYTILNSKEANYAGIYIQNIILTFHPLVQSGIRTLRRQRLARQKSPILTAQTTRPLIIIIIIIIIIIYLFIIIIIIIIIIITIIIIEWSSGLSS